MQQAIAFAVLATVHVPDFVQRVQAIEKLWKLAKLIEHTFPVAFT